MGRGSGNGRRAGRAGLLEGVAMAKTYGSDDSEKP